MSYKKPTHQNVMPDSGQSPTRQAAVQFLQASPENPFFGGSGAGRPSRHRGRAGDDPRYQMDHMGGVDPMARTYQAARSGAGLAPAAEASPQSGVKNNLYSQLQDEIRREARSRASQDPYATCNQPFLDPHTVAPSRDYYYAEQAKSGALANIGESPERQRPVKSVNPYDCFRSGEARTSIV